MAKKKELNVKSLRLLRGQANDYTNHYIHTKVPLTTHIPEFSKTVAGYPKLERLLELKAKVNSQYFTRPFGCRVEPEDMISVLTDWVVKHHLCFDTIMIGSLTENQFLLPILSKLPLEKLCVKPGFLYIWGSAHKLNELSGIISGTIPSSWSKTFRRSEELVFIQGDNDKSGEFNAYDTLLTRKQWHCSLCITGTVKRDVDGHLIHCNINPDLKIEDEEEINTPSAVPDSIYKIAENFASGNRRLHIIPSRTGLNTPVRMRNGWVIMSPDVLLNNFDPAVYMEEIDNVGFNVGQNPEIENLRPKSPIFRKSK